MTKEKLKKILDPDTSVNLDEMINDGYLACIRDKEKILYVKADQIIMKCPRCKEIIGKVKK